MADKKVSELDTITGADTASDDFFLIVDTSGSVSKKISRTELNNAIERDIMESIDIDGGAITGVTIDNSVIGGTTAAAGTFTTVTAEGYNLSAIATDIADTAVDVFVYDTNKDSDGGAWRHRTQNTSWYNETLNTSTRGSRKEFPAVAVIVAEATQLTIYDGDDPDLPMWMVFNAAGSTILYSATTLESVFMVNGYMVVGSAATVGIAHFDFVADKQAGHRAETKGYQVASISERNSATGSNNVAGYWSAGIVNAAVNGVAMTVLPNAPVDADTGLPVPTIAVATDGGVSVITDSGAVYDISSFSPIYTEFMSDNRLVAGTDASYQVGPIPSSDAAVSAWRDYYLDSSTTPAISFSGRNGTANLGEALATDGGLVLFDEDTSDYTNGLAAYVTSDYNTGYMVGDIKLAALSNTDATNVTGSELVTNGTFDTDTSGWTAGGGATLSIDSQTLKILSDSDGNSYAYQSITTVVGKSYTVSYDLVERNVSARLSIYSGGSEIAFEYSGAAAVTGTFAVTFVATATTSEVRLWNYSPTASVYNRFDNVSVRLADIDRSVNENGLQVFGTVNKTAVATGAELVAYSNFSTSNYLNQPYNSDFNFGTGDFAYMFWVNGSASANETLIDHSNSVGGTANPRIRIHGFSASTGVIRLYASDGSLSLELASTLPVLNDTWNCVCIVRSSGTAYIYVNGVLDVSSSYAGNITRTTGQLRIGLDGDLTDPLANGSLALLRISATAPSAAQIAKMYNDEKYLFQDNADATLYGSSDAVTALAYDDRTQLLHAGTSAGRSVFQGLRRVDNTTDAVGATISASNGLVADD